MRADLCALGREHWPELYRLMVAEKFPSVPKKYVEAEPYFGSVTLFGLQKGSELIAGFVFGKPEDGIAHFDVVCRADARGLWATIPVLKKLFELAFVGMGLRCVWVQPHGKVALRAALKIGFVPATPLNVPAPVLVMTPANLPRGLRMDRNKEDCDYGKSV